MPAASKGMLLSLRPRTWRLAILAFIVVLIVITIALITVSRHALPVRHQKEFVEQRLSRLLGLAVSVNGPVTMRMSLRPRINVKDVHVRQEDGDSKVDAFVAKDISVRLDLLPLLSDKWSIRRLEVTDAELCVSMRRGARCDWRPALAAIDRVTNVDDITVRRLKLSCHGGLCGKTLQQKIALVSAHLPAHGSTSVSIYLEDEHKPVAEFAGGSWSEFRRNRPWRTEGTLRFPAMQVAVAGTVGEPRELRGFDLKVEGRAQLGHWHGIALGEPHVRGHLVEDGDAYRLDIDRGEWGTGKVVAELKAEPAPDGLQIDGTVNTKGMDLDPWMDVPTEGEASGGQADATATFMTTGNTVDEWLDHLKGSARIDAGPAQLPIDQVERWSKGLLKFVFSLPAEGKATHIQCMGGQFDLHNGRAVTNDLRIDTETTRMRGMGSLALSTGEVDMLVKPTLKHGPLKDAPLVQVTGDIKQPVARLASDEAKAEAEPVLEQLPDKPVDAENPCR